MTAVADTLFIRHLPASLTTEERCDLLKHFGATHVKCMSDRGKLKYTAFATFSSEEEAKSALERLHQLEILDQRLIVQFANKCQSKHFPSISDFPSQDKKPVKHVEETPISKKEELVSKLQEYNYKINTISHTFGLSYPLSPRLKYRYPPPTTTILMNIVNTMAAVPKFYTQVLHLMNKMNLPHPFGAMTPVVPVTIDTSNYTTTSPEKIKDDNMEVTSSEESEIESDNESERKPQDTTVVSLKRPGSEITKKMKRPKLQKVSVAVKVSSVSGETVNPNDVFDKPDAPSAKKISFGAIGSTIGTENTEKEGSTSEGGFGSFAPVASNIDSQSKNNGDDSSRQTEFITSQELHQNRLSKDEIRKNSLYRNYEAGTPTSRLYIKNLSKQVEEKDLRYVYGRYVNFSSEEEAIMFDIRLMKEGRMKGQAFVNLPSETKAQKALKDTNGFNLFGKPLVVQFARSAKPKEVEKTSK